MLIMILAALELLTVKAPSIAIAVQSDDQNFELSNKS